MNKVLFCILMLLLTDVNAQTHKWAESFSSQNSVRVIGIDLDNQDNTYAVGTFTDTVKVQDITLKNIKTPINGPACFLSKQDKNGKILWMRSIQRNSTSSMTIASVNVVTNNKIVVYGSFLSGVGGIVYFSKNDSIVVPSGLGGSVVLLTATYDSSGNVLNYQLISKQVGFTIGYFMFGIQGAGYVESDSQGYIYLTFHLRSQGATTYLYSAKDSALIQKPKGSKNAQAFIAKYNSSFDSIIWIKELANFEQGSYSISKLKMGRDNNLYIASNFNPFPGSLSVVFEDTTYTLPVTTKSKGIAVVMNTSGNVIYKGYVNQNLRSDYISSIDAVDTSEIYVVGAAKDTILRNGKKFYTENALPPRPFSPVGSLETMFPYVAKFSTRSMDWVKMPNKPIVSNFVYASPSQFKGGMDKNNFFYASIWLDIPSSIGGLTRDSSPGRSFIKFDDLGNALWILNGPIVEDMQPSSENNLTYSGMFFNTRTLMPFTLKGSSSALNGFVAKIMDYSITRGEVSKGPYCAGDTFLVPYSKLGTYDTANFFIAELSDEKGKFEGKERELGRIKATEDSTIIGQLPLFQVATSANYRIRVRSTNPPVQSFFLRDSLRLLIYSRDKANPGPTETACFGDSFKLNTFGGTAWQWSPAYRMDNPNARNPKIYPDKDTIFQIIISDSSGCGAPDTAFKQILIRSNPKIQTDSLVEACLNIDAALMAQFSKGDSSGYRWTWYTIQDSNKWQALKKDSFSTTDTFYYRYSSDSALPINFALVLTDGCSRIKDTAYTTVILTPKPMRGALSTIDTLICYQSAQTLIANFTGGDSNTYKWQWNEAAMGANFNPLQSDSLKTTDRLAVRLLPQNRQTQRYALVSKDGCTPIVDTAYFTFNIAQNQPQAKLLPQDSAICPGTAINLQANISSGTALGYHWKWQNKTATILQSDTGFVVNPLTVNPDFSTQTAQNYTFILMDNCSPYSDTVTTTVLPRADLQATPSKLDTTLCRGQSIVLNATGTGGVTADYVFRWLAKERETVLSTANKLTLIADTSMLVLLVLSDNCMPQNDTVTIAIKVKPSLQVALITQAGTQAQDTTVCNGTAINYTLNGKGGDSTNYAYNWYWNDSLISTAKTLNFTPTENKTTPTTHHLKLILKDGCTAANDTTSVAVTILPPINAFFTAADTLCLGQATTITANATGGKGSTYTYQWYWNNSLISTANPLNFKSSSANNASLTANNLKLVTADGCTAPNNSFTYTIYVKPALALSLTASTICATPTATLTANTVGGNPNSYAIRWWDENNNAIGTGNSITVNPTALTTYKAILTDGCSADSAFVAIQIDKLPTDIKLTASPVQGCEPLTVTFELQTNYPSAYTAKWSLNTDTSNISNTLQKTFLAGNYGPKVQFTSTLGCDTTLTIPALVVHPNPSAAFDYSPQQPDLDSSEVRFKNQSTGAINYNWNIAPFGNFTDFEPTVNYTDTGNFTVKLEAITDQGCRDTAEGSLYLQANFRVYLPNAFSPNGDGINDFYIPHLSGFSEMTFAIYNRWGEQIYETKNNKAWDGTFNGKNAPMGYYFYLLQVKSLSQVRKNTSGSFLLMR